MHKEQASFRKVHWMKHPLLTHFLTQLRKKETRPVEFRRQLKQISFLLAYEAARDFHLKEVPIETPLECMTAGQIHEPLIVVSIMRAGLGMLEGVMEALPFAPVGHIGLYRDKTIKSTVEYYFRLPPRMEGKKILLCDPLLATGDTAINAINRLKDYEVGPIRYLCLLASPEGLQKIQEWHPDVEVYALSLEKGLNHEGLILPGLGDAGDRLYGTWE